MKAISLWQPWASLIACGAKRCETRSWAPPRALIGEPIAIHAAQKVDQGAVKFAVDLCYGQHSSAYGDHVMQGFALADALKDSWRGCADGLMKVFGEAVMPVGCIVAIARLDGAFHLGDKAEGTLIPGAKIVKRIVSRPMPDCFTVRYDDFGDYAPGRWAWLLRDVKPLNPPAPATGHQGFFDLPQGWLTNDGSDG